MVLLDSFDLDIANNSLDQVYGCKERNEEVEPRCHHEGEYSSEAEREMYE